jgi:phage gp36-like protein
MAYATNADVEQRLGHTLYVQLTDDVGTGVTDEAKVTEARSAAEAEIDSYLAGRYRVPVDTSSSAEVATLLRSVSLDLTEWRLHARRGAAPEAVRSKREAAISWLERVAAGRAWLPAVSELAGSSCSGPVAEVVGEPRLLSRSELEGL